MLKRFISALFVPLLLLGAGCSQASLSTNTDSQLTITPVPVEEVVEVEASLLVDGTYTLDTDSSSIIWNGEKRVGTKHTGTIDASEGAVMIEGGAVTGGTVSVDMRTIADTDLVSVEDNKKLVGHLKSDDFFGVATYPTATFALTEAAEGAFTGTMTIKGIENEVAFPGTLVQTENGLELTGIVTLDRTLWDVRYGSDTFFDNLGDELIEDEFTLSLDFFFQKGE